MTAQEITEIIITVGSVAVNIIQAIYSVKQRTTINAQNELIKIQKEIIEKKEIKKENGR